MMNIKNKMKLAHLESQNAMALECIKQIGEVMNDKNENVVGTFIAVNKSLEWFKKYGCEK